MIKVCHISSAHNTYDTRILLKECCSLAKSGYDVSLVIPGLKDEVFCGVKLFTIRKYSNRFKRMTFTVALALKRALKTKSSIYHLHDPELFFVGLFLKLLGKKVVFDVHENITEQIKTKEWLPLNKFISRVFSMVDYINAKIFYLVLAEESYKSIYESYKPTMEIVMNLPDYNVLKDFQNDQRNTLKNELIYVGSVTFDRGIDKIVEALLVLKRKEIDFVFHCIGPVEKSVFEKIQALNNFDLVKDNIVFYGVLKLNEAYEISKRCVLGLSILKPIENYKYSYSTKIFEYMAVGLPVITSNFELYKNVVEKYACGFCVDPLDENQIASAIIELFTNKTTTNFMGSNGIKAVKERYNWKYESSKLVSFYNTISK